MRVAWQRFREWWRGPFIPPQNDPGSSVIFTMGYHRRPWLARVAEPLGRFCRENWKWLARAAGVAIAYFWKH